MGVAAGAAVQSTAIISPLSFSLFLFTLSLEIGFMDVEHVREEIIE
jgi:hypothetical protein